MDYQIWSPEDYSDNWRRQDAEGLAAAERVIRSELQLGHEPVLTVEVPFQVQLKVGEPGAEPKETKVPKETAAEKKAREEAELETNKDKTE